MNFEKLLKYKKYYIAPHTPKTTMLKKHLESCGNCLGFIDSNKIGKGICTIEEIKQDYDYILICSPNHDEAIYKAFSKKTTKEKLLIVREQTKGYSFVNKPSKKKWQNLIFKSKKLFLQLHVKSYDTFKKRENTLFISKTFIGSNNYALFIYMYNQDLPVHLATDNQEQYKTLKDQGLPVVKLESWRFYSLLAAAKWIVQDQGNWNGSFELLSQKQKKMQLWHGIPLKRLNVLRTTTYDLHVSPSDYVNKTSLAEVIQAKKHLGLGYPRNDLLLKEHEPLDIALCDSSLYELVKTRFEKGEKSVIYMPTHRESKHSATPPLDLKKLDDFLETLDIVMVFKLHAFALANINSKQELKNIYFHNASGDVYPLLKYTDILITDYSSVYFDFLFLNRAIVFFDYDYEEYSANMGGFLYDYEEFSPGLHVKTQEQLQKALSDSLKHDEFEEKREVLYERLFDDCRDENCCKRIIKEFYNA